MSVVSRHLIINADDFGLSPAVNAGVVRAHELGIVTSASLMVHQPGAVEAAELAAFSPDLAIGLHVDLGQWDYSDGEWIVAYTRCDPDEEAAVRAECRHQLALFRRLTGSDPTHVDSHQHVHNNGPARAVTTEICEELGVPLRGRDIHYEGGFYGQTGRGEPLPGAVAVSALSDLICLLPEGWTELACHPGLGVGDESSYAHEREAELRTLCDPTLPVLLAEENVRLVSFSDVELGRGSPARRRIGE